MNRFIRYAALTALAVGILPAVASAHVTLQPNEVPAGGFKRLDVRVPNERDDASTKKVEVRFPSGFIFVSHEPVPGWKAKVKMAKLDKHGTDLTFKAIQTYSNGKVVRWIGAPDSDEPAPQVKLTAAASKEGAAGSSDTGVQATPAAATGDSDDDSASDTLSVIALVVGGLGLLAGLAALVAGRRSRATTTA